MSEQPTIRVKMLTALSLGGGMDVFPGEVCDVRIEKARRLILNHDAEVVPPTSAEYDAWDAEHSLIEAEST